MRKLLSLLTTLLLCAVLHAATDSPFACNVRAFSPEVRKRHFDVLGPQLRSLQRTVRELPDGFEFGYAANPRTISLLDEWAEQERLCCPFFDIDVRFDRENGPVWLRLTGRPGTKDFIRSEFVSWISR